MASNSQASFLNTTPPRPSRNGSSQPQKMLEFRVKISENCSIMCQSNGRETIIDMVKTALAKKQIKKNVEYMMFKSSKGYFLNLGKPTGALGQDEDYECIFKDKLQEKAVDSIREYSVQEYETEWNLKSFYLKLSQNRKSQPSVGNITRIADVIQVDFVPEETLFEAIGRDNRLKVSSDDELLLRKWYLKLDDGTEVPLRNKAERCEGKYFELYKNKNPDLDLSEMILPLQKPTLISSDGIKNEDTASGIHLIPLSVTPVRPGKVGRRGEVIDQSVSYSKRTYKLCSDADLENYIKCKLRFKVQKEEDNKAEKERNTLIKKFFKGYDNVASRFKFHMNTDDLYTVSDAVGAVVAEVVDNTEVFLGTCCRIGSEYVLTSRLAVDAYYSQTGLKNVYIYFSSKSGGNRFKVIMKPLCTSNELGYAILRLSLSSQKFPRSLTSCGYCIPPQDMHVVAGNFYTLIGHHSQSNKALDVTCPIDNPGNLDSRVILSLSRRNIEHVVLNNNVPQAGDSNIACSQGMSGSPCLLMNEKLLIGLYSRGIHLQDQGDSVVEQVVLMSAIVEDVKQKIMRGVLPITLTLKDVFDIDQE
ncbi:uncharacterized protein LOC116305673 [Actinia tenebrosa]|uniref:Uncharacterized protein LOC116305673 n=1 Tax=Actinia tenebrosa TaxID=6105 RepID=A0A6P8IW03_ACTTE|nr:uncharacterized protein LOC116305673 [Actinia tenebrosa]XP_031571495.1 uncharacterized protein LOC116305673 [Actinia tenebrosa]XP_031571496.1 uncharacterized protein LOC116305673 [Actinia tenebrosa]